jgi:hypothetical protein
MMGNSSAALTGVDDLHAGIFDGRSAAFSANYQSFYALLQLPPVACL